MRDNSGKFLLLVIAATALLSCNKKEEVTVYALPEVNNAEMFYRGFVTDDNEELVSEIYNFSKKVTRTDTVNGQSVFVYNVGGQNGANRGRDTFFYTDEDGTVWERTIVDIGARVVNYGFSYRTPQLFSPWEILLKMDDGVGTEWEVNQDTTFSVYSLDGQTHEIRYIKKGKARFEGRSLTFLPELQENVEALDAHWYDLSTYFIDQTTSDTLFATEGIAHQYFTPESGAVKYVTNFTQKEKNQEKRALRGTWELMRKEIPE